VRSHDTEKEAQSNEDAQHWHRLCDGHGGHQWGGFEPKARAKEKAEGGEEGAQVNGVEQDAEAGKARWARCGCWPNAVVRPIDMSGCAKAEEKGRDRER